MTVRAVPITMGSKKRPDQVAEQVVSIPIPPERGLKDELHIRAVKKSNTSTVLFFALRARDGLEAVQAQDLKLEWTRVTAVGSEPVQILGFDETLLCQCVVKNLQAGETLKLQLCSDKT
jgi:hypothetical protein